MIKYSLAALMIVFNWVKPMAQIQPSTAEEIERSMAMRAALAKGSRLRTFPVRSVGPVVQGGRVVDIAVNLNNTLEYYVAYASGGLFKTVNNGISFQPVFDNQGALSIGDIALAGGDYRTIYVGTGEKNSSRSSYYGSGVYRSQDGGESWQHLGLSGTQHISRIIVHPENPDIIWVAAIGALYTHNEDRGVFKTTNGGQSWEKTLFVSDSTGIIDLVLNPQNPDQLWAASWERTRKAWGFKGNGAQSAIYRSDNGGERWFKVMNGFPMGEQLGRIGLDVCSSQPNIIYALLDNQVEIKKPKEKDDKLAFEDFRDMSEEGFLQLEDDRLNAFLRDNNFPEKYDAEKVRKEVMVEKKYNTRDIADYFGDANAALVKTSILGAELYRSDDFGATWMKMNSYDLEGVYFTYGYYFGEVRVAPDNPDVVYIFGVPLLKSTDGGVHFSRLDTLGDVHVDHQALWINPVNPKHMLLGNDGGLYQSYDEGANWLHLNNAAVGQFYTVNYDMGDPYHIYGGLQDNGSLVGSSQAIPNQGKRWEKLYGGDGMFVAPDPRDDQQVYVGYQFGHYFRLNRRSNEAIKITPRHDIGEEKLRFNWRTPLIISQYHPDILYIGAQKVLRSMDQGTSWTAISEDLTQNQLQENVPFSTITSISESPLQFGLLYVGTDDGNVQVTRSGGNHWTLISENLPEGRWVSSVFASPHKEGEVYVSLNGYRNDEFKTYVFASDNFGVSWRSIRGNLPEVVVNVIVQDPKNADLLYIGTDHGVYISFDRGGNWDLLDQLPNVSAYDMKVHPRENELMIATHGRSIYVVDVEPLQKVAGVNLQKTVTLVKPEPIKHSETWGESKYPYLAPDIPEIEIPYYLSQNQEEIKVEIFDVGNKIVARLTKSGVRGFNVLKWDLMITNYEKKLKKGQERTFDYAEKGRYRLRMYVGEEYDETELVVE